MQAGFMYNCHIIMVDFFGCIVSISHLFCHLFEVALYQNVSEVFPGDWHGAAFFHPLSKNAQYYSF